MSEPETHTMRAMSATASWLDRLNRWWKRALFIAGALVVLRGVYEWGETAYGVVGDFGPLQTQVRAIRGDHESHLEDYRDHEAAHQAEHGEFHDLGTLLRDSVIPGFGTVMERVEDVNERQSWLMCLAGQDRDREAGRPVRDCTPMGPSGGS